MKQTRRDFLQTTTLAAGSFMLGAGHAFSAQDAGKSTFNAADKVTLGKSGLKVTRLSLGTGMKGGQRQSNHTRMGLEKFTSLVRGAHDRGSRFFDLADLYGTHDYFTQAMKGVPRGDYALITKIWWNKGGIPEAERPDADVVVKRFLKELKTDHLDLVLLHCVTSAKWNQELAQRLEKEGRHQGAWRELPFVAGLASGGKGAVGGFNPRTHQSLRCGHGWEAGGDTRSVA
jgi:hypothetical protein